MKPRRPTASVSRSAEAALLPAGLEGRAFAPAWGLALAVHLALMGVVAVAPSARVREAPLIRLVFVEPPPPPAPVSSATAPTPSAPEAPPVAQTPQVVEPKRLHRTTAMTKPRPRLVAKPRPTAPTPEPAGVIGGTVPGQAGGVAGGIAGGVVGGIGTNPVPVSQVAQPPRIIRRVPPTYPAEARRNDIEGLVVIEAVLDRDGHIEPTIKVLKSVPPLDAEAVAAVRQWRFRPARNAAGEPLRVILEIPIRFVLT